MRLAGKRCPFKLSYKVSCDEQGKILAVSGTAYADNDSPPTDFEMAYNVANWDIKGVTANTNTPMNTAMRAPSRLGQILFIETIVDHVATLVGKQTEQIRALNLSPDPDAAPSPLPQIADLTQTGAPPIPEKLPSMFQAVMSQADISELRTQCADFNAQNLWRKRGVAAVPTEYPSGWGPTTHHGVHISVYPDATILIYVTGVEVGQGLFTK